jgi:lysophospholipase
MMYGELILDLDEAGYDVYIMDHRGMGFSGRLAPNPKVAHVERFSDYVDDLHFFLKSIVQHRVKGPLHMVAHSMGGLVGAYLVQREPSAFKTVVFSAPLFELNTGRVPRGLAYLTASLNTALGMGTTFAPGQGDYDPATADPNRCKTTHSVARCLHQIKMYQSIPETFLAGPSNQWVKTVIEASRARETLALAFGRIPVLILQASSDDFVRPSGQRQFCQKAQACRLLEIPETYHEIFQEKDTARRSALKALFEHLRS